MQPIVNGLENDFGGRVAFEQRNADDPVHQTAMNAYGLRGHPSYVVLNPNGEVLWSATGPLSEAALRQAIEQVAAPSSP